MEILGTSEIKKERSMTDMQWDFDTNIKKISALVKERTQLWENRENQPLGERYEAIKSEIGECYGINNDLLKEMQDTEEAESIKQSS